MSSVCKTYANSTYWKCSHLTSLMRGWHFASLLNNCGALSVSEHGVLLCSSNRCAAWWSVTPLLKPVCLALLNLPCLVLQCSVCVFSCLIPSASDASFHSFTKWYLSLCLYNKVCIHVFIWGFLKISFKDKGKWNIDMVPSTLNQNWGCSWSYCAQYIRACSSKEKKSLSS